MSAKKRPDYEEAGNEYLLFVAGCLAASGLWLFLYFSKVLPSLCS